MGGLTSKIVSQGIDHLRIRRRLIHDFQFIIDHLWRLTKFQRELLHFLDKIEGQVFNITFTWKKFGDFFFIL